MPSPCSQIKQEYAALQAQKQEFVLKYQKLKESNDLKAARALRIALEQARDKLKEKLWVFEALPQQELKDQYQSQKEKFERLGILEKLSTGEFGIKGIDDQEYIFPNYQEIVRMIMKNRETLEPKTEQGFNQLLIVPFGMKLDDLIEKYKQVILEHHKNGSLLATKENPTDPDEQLELNESQPVWAWDKYNNADVSGELVYFPEEFSSDHKGKTKLEILNQNKQGFNILLF